MASLAVAQDQRLVEAVERQDRDAVRTLLAQSVDVDAPQPDGATALHWAAHWNDLDTATLLIAAGANVNAMNELGVTPLSLPVRPALPLLEIDALPPAVSFSWNP